MEDDEIEIMADGFIKDAGSYLIVIKHCRWDGSTGYRLINDKRGVLARDYDVTQTDPKSTRKKKVMTWVESSHDVPTGSPAAAIALTKRETNYIQMLLGMGDFDKIDDFVERYATL